MAAVPVRVRPATAADSAHELLYASAAAYYDRFAGTPADARRILASLWPSTGHTASFELALVAEEAGAVVGVVAGFAVRDADRLVRAFIRRALPRVRPWQLPGTFAHLRAAQRVSPVPPASAWYVDALAVAPHARRRGVCGALLDAAADAAREAGTSMLALDTGLDNTAAQAFYANAGFRERDRLRAPDERTAAALGGPGFVSYARRL